MSRNNYNKPKLNEMNPRDVTAHEMAQNMILFDHPHKLECGINVMVTWKTGETRYGKLLLSPDKRLFVAVMFKKDVSFYIEMTADGTPYPTSYRQESITRNDPSFIIEGWRYLTEKEDDDRPCDTYLTHQTYLGQLHVLSPDER